MNTESQHKYFVDGHTTERFNGYCVWRVIDDKGNILAKMHGPMSRTAALSFCRALNNGTEPSVTVSEYDNSKHGDIVVNENDFIIV